MSAAPTLPEEVPRVNGAAAEKANGVANGHTNGHTYEATDRPVFELYNQPVENFRPIKVICIGAGYSGIYCGIRIPERLRHCELTIYEKNSGFGGTWYENRYPGCACDIPSHSYQFSFEPNHSWTSLYSPSREIQAYLEKVAKKYSVDRFTKLRHEIVECRFDERESRWHVKVKNLATGEVFEDNADILISARGNLNNIAWPEIEGLWDFNGEIMHSAKWNQEYDFKNKKIGVIGAGSSAIQIIPSLQRVEGAQIASFVRSRTWISPPFGHHLYQKLEMTDPKIPEAHRERFKTDTEYYQKFRLAIEEDGNAIHAFTLKDSPTQKGARIAFEEHMRSRLETHPHILEALIPSFAPGCRRLTPGPGYLESLTQPNVNFIKQTISKIEPTGVRTGDGNLHEIDVLVCATGFHTSAPPPFPVIGAKGVPITKHWVDRATNYLSLATDGFPNQFFMLGPNAAIGAGSLTMMIESTGDYIIKAIRKMQKENIRRIEIKKDRVDDFGDYCDAYFEKTVYMDDCKSWYRNKRDGKVTGLWPGSTLHCIEALRSPRWEDYEYEYVGDPVEEDEVTVIDEVAHAAPAVGKGKKRNRGVNRMAWLGNGWAANQLDIHDLAWYLYPEFLDIPNAPKPEENKMYKIRPFSN